MKWTHPIASRTLTGFLICVFLSCSQASFARPSLVFTCSLPEAMPYRLALEKAYSHIFNKLGYDFSVVSYPVSRGLAMLEAGLVDGDCSRSKTLFANIENESLVRVDVVIRSTDYGIWSYSAKLENLTLNELRERNFRIGYSKGSLVIEDFLERQGLDNVVAVEGLNNGLRMLSANRFDLYLVGNGLVYEQEETLHLRAPLYMKGVLFHDQSFPYLHKKHKKLRRPFERELKKLIDAGGIPVEHH